MSSPVGVGDCIEIITLVHNTIFALIDAPDEWNGIRFELASLTPVLQIISAENSSPLGALPSAP